MSRTRGATSNLIISLKTLNEHFNASANIPIARRFADENGLLGKAVRATERNLKAAGNQPVIVEKISIQEIKE